MGCFPSTPTETWLEFRGKMKGGVTIVLGIPPPTPPVSDMYYAGIDLIKDTAGDRNTPYPDTCARIADAYN